MNNKKVIMIYAGFIIFYIGAYLHFFAVPNKSYIELKLEGYKEFDSKPQPDFDDINTMLTYESYMKSRENFVNNKVDRYYRYKSRTELLGYFLYIVGISLIGYGFKKRKNIEASTLKNDKP